ncbi:MAG: hypothetical protein GVY28_07875, partial [Alphaproteobacteria bacterium]|nr:hypothetical protein [Alphaproteobacteria bacterium]
MTLIVVAATAPRAGAQHAADPPPAGGVTIRTSAEADSLLAKADTYLDNTQWRDGLLYLQAVADRFGSTLTHVGDGLYIPARLAVERRLRRLADESGGRGLRAYRLAVDGAARGLLGDKALGSWNESALREVARRYFISSRGDDAAYALACLMIDRGRWQSARRWLA